MNLRFTSPEHRQYFATMVSGDKPTDAIYYLLGADNTLRNHISDVLVDGELRKNALRDSWQTSTSKKYYALALNLLYDLTYPEAIDIYRGKGGYDQNMVFCNWLND